MADLTPSQLKTEREAWGEEDQNSAGMAERPTAHPVAANQAAMADPGHTETVTTTQDERKRENGDEEEGGSGPGRQGTSTLAAHNEEQEEEDGPGVDRTYSIEAILAVRRATDWTPYSPSFQMAVKWEGYERPTWEPVHVLENDRYVLELVLGSITDPNHTVNGPLYVCYPQSRNEADGSEVDMDTPTLLVTLR